MNPLQTSKLTRFAFISLITFGVLICIFIGLPIIFSAMDVSSFQVGQGDVWLLKWQNDADGFGIEFNIVPLLVAALIVGFISMFIRRQNSRQSGQ